MELGSGEVLVVVLVGTIVIGVEGVEVDATGGKQGQHRVALTGVLEVSLRHS